MTCIVGVVAGGVVAMGGDSAATADCAIDLITSPKVRRVGDLLIGACGSPRVSDVVHYWLDPPAVDDDPLRWMVRVFVPTLTATFRATDVSLSKEDHNWSLLVAAGGRLFAVYQNLQIEETPYGFHAIGCGAESARGALHAMSGLGALAIITSARQVVEIALRASESSDVHVRAPFVIEEMAITD